MGLEQSDLGRGKHIASSNEYLHAYPEIEDNPDHFIFSNTKSHNFNAPIKRGQSWKFIATICKEVGLRGHFGTHRLRKTWGYHTRRQGVDLALVMHKLNHSSIATTKRYPNITDEELQEVVQQLNL